MKQNLVNIGQKLTELINYKLQEENLSKRDYLILLEKLEFMISREIRTTKNEIVEVKTIEVKTMEVKNED